MDKRKFYLIAVITTILFCWTTLLIWKGFKLAKQHTVSYQHGSRMNDALLETDRTYAKQSLSNAIYYQQWLAEGRTDLIKESLNAQIANNVISLSSFSSYYPTQSQIDALKQTYPSEYETIYNAFISRHPDANETPFQKQINIAFYSYLQQSTVEDRQTEKTYEKFHLPSSK